MPLHIYDVILTAKIEIGGQYWGNTAAEAIDAARLDLKANGELSEITVERQMLVDDEPVPDVQAEEQRIRQYESDHAEPAEDRPQEYEQSIHDLHE